jgi:hypothetical protein
MGRFGQIMIYFGKKWGRFGSGGVIHYLFSVHELNPGALNIFVNTIKICYLRLTFA